MCLDNCMKKPFKDITNFIIGSSLVTVGGFYFGRGAVTAGAKVCFRQGLQFKVEDIADADKNGSLNVDEMVAICNTLKLDAVERFRNGFYLSVEESQKYLKLKDRFDPQIDACYKIGKTHPSFLKAETEGKQVHYFQLF